MTHFYKFTQLTIILVFASISLSGCSGFSGVKGENVFPVEPDYARRAKRGKLSGEGGLKLFSTGGDERNSSGNGSGIGVNSFLWHATLDTLSFIPLSSVDPHGGVIITDWYEDPSALGEKFKINVFILGTKLRTDGLKLSLFKQVKDSNGKWETAEVSKKTTRDLEDKILFKARELKINSAKE